MPRAAVGGFLPDYIFRAVERDPAGVLSYLCHESEFQAADLESAVVTANALFEVIPVADKCNSIEVLDPSGGCVWSRATEPHEHLG